MRINELLRSEWPLSVDRRASEKFTRTCHYLLELVLLNADETGLVTRFGEISYENEIHPVQAAGRLLPRGHRNKKNPTKAKLFYSVLVSSNLYYRNRIDLFRMFPYREQPGEFRHNLRN
jgi:hypothetical protein